jgi:hypothetical protein
MPTSRPTRAAKIVRITLVTSMLVADVAVGFWCRHLSLGISAAAITLLLGGILRFYRSCSFLES